MQEFIVVSLGPITMPLGKGAREQRGEPEAFRRVHRGRGGGGGSVDKNT
jgi:hypothetical protein